jgi:predicted permease
MRWARLWSFCRNALRRSEMERNMSEELQFHLERRAEDLVAHRGLSPDQAMRAARLEFGSMEKYKEEARQSLGLRLLDELRADLRYALRTFGKNKGFTAAAIATLALGIGANTAVFSVVDALLIRELPVKDPKELVVFDWLRTQDSMVAGYSGYGRQGPGTGLGVRSSFSALTVERFREHTATLSHVFAFSPVGTLNIIADRQTDTASGLLVTGDYFAGLGVPALIGRTISSSDDNPNAEPVAVISHRYWQRRFAGDPSVVGKAIEVNRSAVVIVGVTPNGFDGPRMSESFDVTLPIGMASRIRGFKETARAWPAWMWWMQMMGRLRPGITRDQALANLQSAFLDTVRESWAARPSDTPNPTRTGIPQLRVRSGAQGPDGPRVDAQQILSLVFAVVGAVLLIGCVNLANLFLVRASARRQEVSVRLTLGASRCRVIRQLLTESLLLALTGGVVGVILALWGKEFMVWLPTRDTPIVDARIDWRVLAVTAGLSAIAALAFGIGPALRATRADLGQSLKTSAQKGGVIRGIVSKALLTAQVAISLVLLTGAGLLVRTLYNLGKIDVGFNADNLLVFRINPVVQGGRAPGMFDLYERLMSAIEAVPGVQAASMSVMPVIASREWDEDVRPDGAGDPRTAFIQVVRWNFLETMGIPLLSGRGLSAADIEGRPRVAVVNDTMARQIFGDPSPVGRHFQFVNGRDRNVPIQVVGVARDSKYSSLQQRTPPTLFMPHTQVPPGEMTVEVRTAADPIMVVPAIREAVRQIDPSLPLSDMKTEQQQIAETIGKPRAFALLTAAAAAVALLLACVGLYGIVSYDATRRTNEIGIRMALGARRHDVLRLVMRQTIVVVMVGAAIGLGLALVTSRLIVSLLFGIQPTDPLTIASAVAILFGVAVLASYVPARRASRLDPTQALRYE